MTFLDAVRLALDTIRVQKLKSFFTLLGVAIGVMFLIAIVSVVENLALLVIVLGCVVAIASRWIAP